MEFPCARWFSSLRRCCWLLLPAWPWEEGLILRLKVQEGKPTGGYHYGSLISLLLFWWICWDIQKKSTEPCLVLAGARLPKGIAFLAKDSDDFVKGCWWRVMVGWQKLWGLDRIGTSGDSGWRSSFSWGFACGDEIPESWKKAPPAKTCSSRV